MERNIKVVLDYDGTSYHGWQYQKNAVSVQEMLELAILRLTGETTRITGAGRTDAGVHARGQVANFRIQNQMQIHRIVMGLNAYLPEGISVKSAEAVNSDFNARFSAKKRIYQYHISTEPTALTRHFCWHFFKKFDPDLLNPLAHLLIGEHDFSSFTRVKTETNSKICKVYESYWRKEDHIWIYRIAANRFLHGMVRTIVGTLMDAARSKISMEKFIEIFRSKNRILAGRAAPAKGLILEKVIY